MTTKKPAITVVAAIIRGVGGQIFLSKRPHNKHQGGHWEFPGGKVEPGETLDTALARELDEELGMVGVRSAPFMTLAHAYPDLYVTLHFRQVTEWQGEPEGREGQQVAWHRTETLPALSFPAANRPVVTALSLPPQLAIAPSTLSLHELEKGLVRLDPATQGVYLREWTHSDALPALTAQCREKGLAFWLRADASDPLMLEQQASRAQQLGATGLHLTANALDACQHRPVWTEVVSAACHDRHALQKARALELDMLLVSPVAATPTHPQSKPLGWQQAAELMRGAPLACYALGGMTPADLEQARENGAVGVAGIRAFWP